MLTKYEVLEELGHGGMATVYRAHDKRLARDVAIKVLHPHLRDSLEIAHRFEAEAKAVAKLRHRNIVEVFDVSSADEPEHYLVVEFVRGQTLRKLLQKSGPLPPEVAAALGVELLGALSHAHQVGVVHRDVKPENVLLEHYLDAAAASNPAPNSGATPRPPVESSRGDRVAVKLTDFGIAKLLDAQGVTSTGQVLGSPAHMAPEQIEGGDVDGRADVFGMGVLLYECMVGHLPFEGNNPAQVLRRVLDGLYPSAERARPSVGRIYSQILDRALARQPADRYASAEEMCNALTTELTRLGITTPRTELESFFDDPDGWKFEQEKRLIERLCALGFNARKRGDAVAAAADFNRALAYAPNDPQLLRIVASMHRSEARSRLLRRVGPLVLGTLALGTSAFFVTRALKGTPPAELAAVAPRQPASSSRIVPVASSEVQSQPSASALVHAAKSSLPPVVDAATARRKRTVTFVSLQPQFGVKLRVDGVAAPDPVPGGTIVLPDDRAHSFSFTCQDRDGNQLCIPKSILVEAGESESSLDVQLSVLPASLLVEGESGRSYSILEVPNITLAAGIPSDIPMLAGRAARTVTVFDRSDPQKGRQAPLRAGQRYVLSFKNP